MKRRVKIYRSWESLKEQIYQLQFMDYISISIKKKCWPFEIRIWTLHIWYKNVIQFFLLMLKHFPVSPKDKLYYPIRAYLRALKLHYELQSSDPTEVA